MAVLFSAVGVPDNTRVEAVNSTPAGRLPVSEYVSGASPPLAAGSVTATATSLTQLWSAAPDSSGVLSVISIVNFSVCSLPFQSSTLYV